MEAMNITLKGTKDVGGEQNSRGKKKREKEKEKEKEKKKKEKRKKKPITTQQLRRPRIRL